MLRTRLAGTSVAVLVLMMTAGCGSSSSSSPSPSSPAATATPTPTTAASGAVAFTTVQPIFAANCAGSSCHSTGSPYISLFDYTSAATVATNKTSAAAGINGTSSAMPPVGSPQLSAADKQTLLTYLAQ